MRLAFCRGFHVAVDQHDVDTGLGGDEGDAGAHEAGAKNGDFFQLCFRLAGRAAGEPVKSA